MTTSKAPDQGQSTPEQRAEAIVRSALTLNKTELAQAYRTQSFADPSEKIYALAAKVAAEYRERGEPVPEHVAAMLAGARQQVLPLEGFSLASFVPKLLLTDGDVERVISRKSMFEQYHYRVEMAFTLEDALARLDNENFQGVVVEWMPAGPDEMQSLQRLQTWNIHIPVINVAAWSRFARETERQFNWNLLRALARALGRPVPRRLPARKPAASDSEGASGKADLFETTG